MAMDFEKHIIRNQKQCFHLFDKIINIYFYNKQHDKTMTIEIIFLIKSMAWVVTGGCNV